MSKVLGIIGGGQLGMMLTEAAQNMKEEISKIIVLDPTENCPASKVGAEQIIADFKDKNAIKKLSELSDIITYEIESGDSDVLKKLEELKVFQKFLRILKNTHLPMKETTILLKKEKY